MTTAETCDRCGDGVRATHRAKLPSGAELMFCDHHTREASPGVVAAGGVIVALEPATTSA